MHMNSGDGVAHAVECASCFEVLNRIRMRLWSKVGECGGSWRVWGNHSCGACVECGESFFFCAFFFVWWVMRWGVMRGLVWI